MTSLSKSEALKDFQKATYDKRPESEDFVKNQKLMTQISRLAGKEKRRVLDVGCGSGKLLGNFAKIHECYGVDISTMSLLDAESRGITTYCVDLEKDKLPVSSSYFDIVICSEVIEHIFNIDNMFSEMNRILKTGGRLLLTFPNVNQPASWFAQIVLDLPPMYSARYKSAHVRDYTIRIARKVVQDFGFSVVSVEGTYIYPFKGRFSRWIAGSFPRFAEKVIITAAKTGKPQATKDVVWDSRCV